MQNKVVLTNLITKAVQGTFEPKVYQRYLKQFNLGASPTAEDAYAIALNSLNDDNTEMCIGHIIATLDIDKEHKPVFHLAKTMLFSLSEEFDKANGAIYKQKHSDLKKYLGVLRQTIEKIESEILSAKNNLKQLEADTGFIAKMKNKSKIAQLQQEIPEIEEKLTKNKKEYKKLSYLSQIEEYTKVLSLVLEVITFPSRYGWVYKS